MATLINRTNTVVIDMKHAGAADEIVAALVEMLNNKGKITGLKRTADIGGDPNLRKSQLTITWEKDWPDWATKPPTDFERALKV